MITFVFSNQVNSPTWEIDFGDDNGFINGNPSPTKTYTNNTGNNQTIAIKTQITSGAIRELQITSGKEYLQKLEVGNSTLVKNGTAYETLDYSWGLNATFTGDSDSDIGTLLNTSNNATDMSNIFNGASILTTVPSHLISGVTNMSQMFHGASLFNADISSWNTSNVSNMQFMFNSARNFNQNINTKELTAENSPTGVAYTAWNTSSVTTMYSMFQEANSFNQPIGDWDTSNVVNMSNMLFAASQFNQDIGNWDTSSVRTMSHMFYQGAMFNPDIGNWDTSSVNNMTNMFNDATAFNQNINTKELTDENSPTGVAYTAWNTSNVTNMYGVFHHARAFDQPIGNWDTSSVANMTNMFNGATAFNKNIGNWDTSSVANMTNMFNGATAFNQDINTKELTAENSPTGDAYTAWNTSNVTTMNNMFYEANAFNKNIGNWDTSSVANMTNMFNKATTFNQFIRGWDISNVDDFTNMFLGADEMISTYGGTPGFGTDPEYTPTSDFFNFVRYKPVDKGKLQTALISWYTTANQSDGNGGYTDNSTTANSVTKTQHDDDSTTYPYFGNPNTWDVMLVTDMSSLFKDIPNISTYTVHPEIVSWDVSNVTTMNSIFHNATNFNQDIGNWNTIKVTNMKSMFENTNKFNQYIGDWDTSSVTDMNNMFNQASAFNQDIGKWDTSSVLNMGNMFNYATGFNQNISILNTINVIQYVNMFKNSGITNTLHGFTVPTPVSTEFNKDIGINGYNSVTIERTTTYVDDGAVAASDVTNLTSTTNVNTSSVGTYSVTYTGTKGGNTAIEKTRTVNVVDTTNPVIETSNLVSSINDGETALGFVLANENVTWYVNNSDVQVNSDGVVSLIQQADYQTKQLYTYTITATDDSNNTNSVENTVM